MRDFSFALRQLAKAPGFAAVAMLTLALGIGANTALFTVVYGVLIDPYPCARSNQIWASRRCSRVMSRRAEQPTWIRWSRLGVIKLRNSHSLGFPNLPPIWATRP